MCEREVEGGFEAPYNVVLLFVVLWVDLFPGERDNRAHIHPFTAIKRQEWLIMIVYLVSMSQTYLMYNFTL